MTLKVRILQFSTTFTQVYTRPKKILLGSSLAFTLKEGPVRCAKVCNKSWVILPPLYTSIDSEIGSVLLSNFFTDLVTSLVTPRFQEVVFSLFTPDDGLTKFQPIINIWYAFASHLNAIGNTWVFTYLLWNVISLVESIQWSYLFCKGTYLPDIGFLVSYLFDFLKEFWLQHFEFPD